MYDHRPIDLAAICASVFEPVHEGRGIGMRLTQVQKTQQKLSMTAVMRNSLALLQLGPSDLAEVVEEETRRNPFLRYVPAAQASGGGVAHSDGREEREAQALETTNEGLLRQIGLISLSASEKRLAQELPYCLDERGFLADPLDDMCGYLDTSRAELIAVVAKVQKAVEPAGMFAWSLRECFRLQLEAKDRWDPLIEQLLERLDLVAKQDIKGICALCGVDEEDAEEMVADIRALRPAPLTPVDPVETAAREPELIFHTNPDGEIDVSLNERALPRILTDDGLFDRIGTVEMDKAAVQYYRDCYRGAAAFVIAVQKRANTLLRIGQEIAAVQGRFVATGRKLDRQPLTMGGIAENLELNKSTISRALNKCRIQTDREIVMASAFFVRPLNDDNATRTREQVLQRLSVLIRTEDLRKPHSDESLVQLLERSGLQVSRRTVAKYRALLGIPGTYERRANGGTARPEL